MNVDQLAREALSLEPSDRARLAEALWESLEDPYFAAYEISDQEALRRAAQRDGEMERGEVVPLSHAELMDRLRGNAD